MFAELFETGMLMLQQYNAGYFKHISDKSYSVMVYAWFVWIQKLTEKHETLLTFVQAPITKAILIDITQKIGLMAKYFADDLRRPIRPDRVSSKTEKQDFEWQTFYDLIDLYKDMALLGDSSHTVDTVRRDLHPALRGDALNLEGQLGATDNSNVMDKLDFVQRVTRIRKKQQGKYQNIKGKKVRSVIPLTKEEEITLTLAQAKGGLLANHENANNANQDIIKDSSIGRYQKQVREARAVDPNQIMDNV